MNIFSEKVDTKQQEAIKSFILHEFDVELRPKPYAFWEIKNKDFVATFYNSGKFVIQGKNINALLDSLSAEFDGFSKKEKGKKKVNKALSLFPLSSSLFPYIGTDESGKGDFFGPLVVAGVLINEENAEIFKKIGVKDSKTLKDKQILEISYEIKKYAVNSVVVIGNEKYNELYVKFMNLNKLLAWGHARVMENILEKEHCEYALSDKFGDEKLILNALMARGQKINLEQRVRAESDIAVAAASILARATFVQHILDLQSFYGCKFPKGCNEGVKDAARVFIKQFGKARLKEVCKAHFKTYHEIM
jgi:ribonuclease HIII